MVDKDKKLTGILEISEHDGNSPATWGKAKDMQKDIVEGLKYKYAATLITMLLLYFFRKHLPFPYPDFFFLTGLIFLFNFLFHYLIIYSKFSNLVCKFMIYFDQATSCPLILLTGGFLSPFIMSHLIAILGSASSYTYSNKSLSRPKILTIILLASYIGISLLQKFGFLENRVEYSRVLMENNYFFYTILFIVSGMILGGYDLITKVSTNLHNQFTNMVTSYQHAVRGITSRTGDYFYSDLLMSASKSLSAKNMILGILSNEKEYLETISVIKHGQLSHNFTIPIKDTPFEKIVKNGSYYLESGFEEEYRDVTFLRGMVVKSFYGRALINSIGETIGVICTLREYDSQYDRMADSLLEIFASRTTAEIEKELYEKENKEIEERLFHSQKMEALGKLSGGIAHDFNNMIGGIQGYSEILRIKLAKQNMDDLLKYPEKINMLTKQASTLTSQLLQFARKGGSEKVKLNINEEIVSLTDMVKHTFTKNVDVRNELHAENKFIMGDSTQLQNAFLNICVNARDAMPDGGSIVIVTEDTKIDENDKVITETSELRIGSFVKITISDSGIGMPKEILNRIFEPFYTTKKPGSGTGLGLSSVFGCIEKHNGYITVASVPGKGTSFFIYLPVAEEDE